MTNVFQPGVFQPNVFQVGTLDVVIPDAPTKRRKWLSISVPGSGRVSGATAFAVSRDSAGILIGVRDKAAPQFGVVRDSSGLLLSAWPGTAPLPTSYVFSGYALGVAATTTVRVSVVYWDASFQGITGDFTEFYTSLTEWQRISSTVPVPPNAAYVVAMIICPRAAPAGAYWTAMQLEGGAVAGAYKVGGKNLLLNPEFTPDLSDWDLDYDPSSPPGAWSRESSLPSAPLSGITSGLRYVSAGPWVDFTRWYAFAHLPIALPVP